MISSARLAWLQLRREKVRLVVAVAGVAFAVILMFMQVGFKDALFRSAVNLHSRLDAEVVLVSANYNVIAFPTAFSRRRLYQARGFPGVRSVSPVYTMLARWKNPFDGQRRDLLLLGIDPEAHALDVPEVDVQRVLLHEPDVALFDEWSRPEYGPVPDAVRSRGAVSTELSGREITVRGLFPLGTSFGIDGTVVTSDLNFRRIFPYRPPGAIGIGLVQLEPGAVPEEVRDRLAAGLPKDVRVLTKGDFMAQEVAYWANATPIGFVFTFGVIMGTVVGLIIVYQILFADIADHLPEYATLKAMGYTNRYLAGVVVMEATLLAVLGFIPGLGVARWLYQATAAATRLPMHVEPARGLLVFGLTLVMCWVSGLLAIRKLRTADPAEVF
jgi:putative ABC transport system permease protein